MVKDDGGEVGGVDHGVFRGSEESSHELQLQEEQADEGEEGPAEV